MTEGANTTVKVWATPPWPSGIRCDDSTHYFDGPEGECRCGQTAWNDPGRPAPKLKLVE